MTIGLIPPRPHGSAELKRLADFKIEPRAHWLASSQFADPIATKKGMVHKPSGW